LFIVRFGDEVLDDEEMVIRRVMWRDREGLECVASTLGVVTAMELNAETTNLREEFARHEDRDQCAKEADSPAEETEADDHGDEANADPAQEFGDERGFERYANRSKGERVLAVRDRGNLVRAVGDRAERAQLRCMLEDFELARFETGPTFLVLRRHRLASPTRALIERHGDTKQRHGDQRGKPAGGPKHHHDADQRARGAGSQALQ
jgi:hypothetical protein